MTASQTIDLINTLNTKDTSKYASSTKSNSGDFEKVFNDVSQNYSKIQDKTEKTSASYSDNTKAKTEEKSVKTNDTKTQKADQNTNKNTESKISDNKQSQKNENDNSAVKEDEVSMEAVTETSEKTEIVPISKTADTLNLIEIQDNTNLNLNEQLSVSLQENLIENAVENTIEDLPNISANITVKSENLLPQAQEVPLSLKEQYTSSDVQVKTPQVQVDLNNETLTKTNTQNIQQSQPQNILAVQTAANESDLKIQSKETTDTTTNLNLIEELNTIPETSEEQAPLVKASDTIENLKLTSEIKQNTKNVLDNSKLNQEKLDELKVEVTSVETTSDTNLSDFNSQQQAESGNEDKNPLAARNAQEQVIRLEIMQNSEPKVLNAEATALNTSNITGIESSNTFNTNALLNNSENISSNAQNINLQNTKELNSTDIMSQINKQIDAKSLQEGGTTKVNIVLKPENLGRLELELVSSKTGLEAKMIASSPQVKEMLDKNLEMLKETLGAQGVNVNNVTVKVAETSKSDTMFSFDQHQKDSQEQNQNSDKASKKGVFSAASDTEEEELLENEAEQAELTTEKTASISGTMGRVSYKV